MALHVVEAGAYSILVDQGRPRHRGLGVPIGGAADRTSHALGNAMVGNEPAALALEIALLGPTLRADGDHAAVVWGADFAIHVNDRAQAANQSFNLRAGDTLRIAAAVAGLRGYLCVSGGFQSKRFLGSRSALEPIRAGQMLRCESSRTRERSVRKEECSPPMLGAIRVLAGAHVGMFNQEALIGEEYRVSPDSNRMGVRLIGHPLARAGDELLSAPVSPGTIQIANDGQPIILGVDAQTIGGYPRIAHVIEADWNRLAQLRPGQTVRFEWVNSAEAERLRRNQEIHLREWVTRLRYSLF